MTSLNFLWFLQVFASPLNPVSASNIPSMNAERIQGTICIIPSMYLVVPYIVISRVESEISIPS